jgi:PAS domain S-box-containing protein
MNHLEINSDYLSREDTPLGRILNCLFDGVYIVDRQRKIIFWNNGAEKMTGYSAEEVSGRSCADDILNHIDENGGLLCRGFCPLELTLQEGQEIELKVYPKDKSGRRFPVMTHIAPIRDASGNIIAGIEVFRDMSREEDFRVLQEKFNAVVQQYVSETAYHEMLEKARTGGKGSARRRDLTILHLDVAGFTLLAENHCADETVGILNDLFGMCDVITRHTRGEIDKFIGDAVLATFIDANDAVDAAQRIQREALFEYNLQRQTEGLDPVLVRIGINSGIVLQGDIGSTERRDLTVIGDVVNCAQRIESLCEPGSFLISESTFARLSDHFADQFTFHMETTVKGRKETIRVFSPKV